MTLLYERQIDGPCTHALVIGTGSYPQAKHGQGVLAQLGYVSDMASAADSALRICDWLYHNRDRLVAPLASLEVLISNPAEQQNRYQCQEASFRHASIDEATSANVLAAGKAWIKRLNQAECSAFMYACGHGAVYGHQPVVFLHDLNADETNPWAHINLGEIAYALQKKSTVQQAFLFTDACGEFVTDFQLSDNPACQFYANKSAKLNVAVNNRVLLMCAAAEGHLAWEGCTPDSPVQFGRFTLVLLMCLNGASSRLLNRRWVVHSSGLMDDIKPLYQTFFTYWPAKEPFEPCTAFSPNEPLPLVYPEQSELPLVLRTAPQNHLPDCRLILCTQDDPQSAALQTREAGPGVAWVTSIRADRLPVYAFAQSVTHAGGSAFVPNAPIFDEWVDVYER